MAGIVSEAFRKKMDDWLLKSSQWIEKRMAEGCSEDQALMLLWGKPLMQEWKKCGGVPSLEKRIEFYNEQKAFEERS